MVVLACFRHPVKSLQAEPLDAAPVVADGIDGDRAWGILDAAGGTILTGRREPRLLFAAAKSVDGSPVITLPGGAVLDGMGAATDEALSAWLGKDVSLVAAGTTPQGRAEAFVDATDDDSEVVAWTMPAGRFVDALPLLVLTTASLRAGAAAHPGGVWDVRRFRPNLLLDVPGEGYVEDAWAGGVLRVGDVELDVVVPCARCTMTTRPQPGLDRDLDVFRAIARDRPATFGVWATVRTEGVVRPGDPVTPP
jgi:uncharacterized protein YcbX